MVGKITDNKKASCSILNIVMGKNDRTSQNDILKQICNANDGKQTVFQSEKYSPAWWGDRDEASILEAGAGKIGLTQLSTQIKEPFVHKTLPLQGSADGTALAENLTIETDVEKGIYVMNKENKITLNGVGILEAKNTSVRPEDVPAPSRGPIQVQGLMMCSGFKWSVISIKYRGVFHRVFVYGPDPELQEEISTAVIDFQKRIDTYKAEGVYDFYPVANPFDGSSTYSRSEPDSPAIKLNQVDLEMVEKLKDAQELIKSGNKLKDECTAYLMSILANHERGEADNLEIRWVMNAPRKEYMVPARPAMRSKSIKIVEHKND